MKTGSFEPRDVSQTAARETADVTTQVAIIGGGLSGALAAVVLGRAGYDVTLIDRHPVYPKEFRVEKLTGTQLELLKRLGVLEAIAAGATRYDNIVNARAMGVLDRTRALHYGILYDDIVRLVRAQLPSAVRLIFERAVDLKTSSDGQRLVLADGRSVEAKLLIIATGMADGLRHKAGIGRRILVEKQSITFGFSLVPAADRSFNFESLTYYGSGRSDAIDYLSLFPIGEITRANLFTFLDHRDPWIRDVRRNTVPTLLKAMPGLRQFTGEFEIVDKIQNWTQDITVADKYIQEGLVLIGDAFQTSCPAAGTGVTRLLTDVDRLCNTHVPQWLETPGMGKDKIGRFYSDPVKQSVDAGALRLADYRRSLTIDPSLRWELRRREHFMRRRVVGWADRAGLRWTTRLKTYRRKNQTLSGNSA